MQTRIARRSVLRTAAGAAAAALVMPGALLAAPIAAERIDWVRAPLRLMMVAARGCPDCAAWRREIGPGYAGSLAGRQAPLMLVDIDGPWPDGLVLGTRPRLTPSFVLLHRGAEVARLEGYAGPSRFQADLGDLLRATRAGAHRKGGGA